MKKFIGFCETNTAVYVTEDFTFEEYRFVSDREEIVKEWVYEVLTRNEVIEFCEDCFNIRDYAPELVERYLMELPPVQFADEVMIDFFLRVDGQVYYAMEHSHVCCTETIRFFEDSVEEFIREYVA